MVNPIIQQMLNNSGSQQSNIMMQAVGAMLRGESPQQFLKNLAKTNPQLQGLDLDNLNQTAENLYKQNGQNINAAKTGLMDKINGLMGK